MRNELENIDDLLGKHLAGEASASESAVVLEWINSSEANRKYYEQVRKIFDAAPSIRDQKQYDTDAAWTKVKTTLANRAKVVPLDRKNATFRDYWWSAAAAVVILLAVGIYLYQSTDEVLQPVKFVAEKKALSDTLPDGTNIFLNKKTKVVYAFDKKRRIHDVNLEGEAYFSVKHSSDEQFIIRAGEVMIRDIGTSFNVKAYPDSEIVEVLVEEGEVIFYTESNPGLRLRESGKAVYDRKTKQFTIEKPEPNITAYKTKFFVFSETRLEEVAAGLNEVYDVRLEVPSHLKDCRLTVSFRNESIDEIAAIISETFGLTVTKQGNRIILNGNGCE